jgi:hypothetical protein
MADHIDLQGISEKSAVMVEKRRKCSPKKTKKRTKRKNRQGIARKRPCSDIEFVESTCDVPRWLNNGLPIQPQRLRARALERI